MEKLKAIEANGSKRPIGPLQLTDGRDFAWFYDVVGSLVGLITSHKEN